MARNPETIDAPYQIICEGDDDCALFSRLVRDRNIEGFQVGCPKGIDGRCLGKDRFADRITAIKDVANEKVKGYVIVADCDDDPTERFKSACNHLKNSGLHFPNLPATLAIRNNLKTAVIMVPDTGIDGGLESLLVSCCDALPEHVDCVESFFQCVRGENRRVIDQDKLKLRSYIAASKPEDPGMSLSYWLATNNRPFLMSHPALDRIANFLALFASTQ